MASVHKTFTLFREGIAAVDVTDPTDQNAGLNFAGYDVAKFQIVPSSGANPDVEVMSWSPGADAYISSNPAATHSGAGVDTPYEISVSAYGRSFWLKVTGGATGSVDVWAAGHRTGDLG